MKGTILITILALTATAILAAPRPHHRAERGTPAEFLQAAVVAVGQIRSALENAAGAIESALVDEPALQAAIGKVVDDHYDAAAELLGPALESLGAATSDQEAEDIVLSTISSLMMIALDTEFTIADAMTDASQILKDEVSTIINTLINDIKWQLKPLWDLTK